MQLDVIGVKADNDHDMEWELNDVKLETNKCICDITMKWLDVSDMIALQIEYSTVELESGEVNV
jgi:hypothetical protein